MFTDIKGFTQRTSHSSREQLTKLLELHDELILPVFEEFGGKVIKTIGDAFLVTFHSPTDAVLCGMKIQKELLKYNEELDAAEKIEIRVAINSGEVTIKNNDVFGEAVNIAARLESIAEAGDIYFTEAVYLAMNKAEIPTAEVGYRHFKGIPEEIKVYKVIGEAAKKGIFGSKYKPIVRGKKKLDIWGKVKKILKWIGIIFLILFILGIISNRKQEEQAGNVQDLVEEARALGRDTQLAFETNDQDRISDNVKRLNEINKELNYPKEITESIAKIEKAYVDKFGVVVHR